jgi:hypothetical protein
MVHGQYRVGLADWVIFNNTNLLKKTQVGHPARAIYRLCKAGTSGANRVLYSQKRAKRHVIKELRHARCQMISASDAFPYD